MSPAEQRRLLASDTTAAVLLGASDWTESGLGLAPSFRRSGKGFLSYLLGTAGLGLDSELILDLFDDPTSAAEQLARLRDTFDGLLRERRDEGRPVKDVVIYYVGHGTTDEQGHLTLLVRRSRRGLETETGIKATDLARVLRVSAPQQRRMVVLDCCFAEAAARAFIGMSATNQGLAAAAAKDIADALPERGGLLLCSSQVGEIAIGAPETKRTLFTNAMLNVLRDGAKDHPPFLSFADLCRLTYDAMLSDFGASAPRPVLHPINQAQGDLSRLPAFPNIKQYTIPSKRSMDDAPADPVLPEASPPIQAQPHNEPDEAQIPLNSKEERRLRRLSRWYSEERILAEDLDFLLSIALEEQEGRLAVLILRVLDSPNATPSALFAVLRGAEDATLISRPPGTADAQVPSTSNQPSVDPDAKIVQPPDPFAVDASISPSLDAEFASPARAEVLASLPPKPPIIPAAWSGISEKYETRAILARGMLATVYDAWDLQLARRVAIKAVQLPAGNDADTAEEIARFRREANAAGRLAHPNIVGIYDYVETDGLACIVMEFVDGPTLKTMLDGDAAFPLDRIRQIMGDLLAGLQYSHSHGVIHRDIKPANVMLNSRGVAKIADFGIARISDTTEITRPGTVMGTPAYMSPEQITGEGIDMRTDLYSAGVLLYQLLVGTRPFDGNFATLMNKVLNAVPIAPSQVASNVPQAVDGVVLKAMAKRPQDRYASAEAFAEALNKALDEPPRNETKTDAIESAHEPKRDWLRALFALRWGALLWIVIFTTVISVMMYLYTR